MSEVNGASADYEQFCVDYNDFIHRGAGVWTEGHPDYNRRLHLIYGIECQLAGFDSEFRGFVDRAALLGPELGGTVGRDWTNS